MKLADRTVEVHSAGIRSASQFNIAQTSKMFKILSDSLYSDKIMAVIRELSTNANDSHISAHNEDPFKVTLPTNANPSFTIRDFGTGLSQQDMENLYTTYGASSKNDSNDFTGCLGLGSKSPFAYTKCFSATSYFNGSQYTYIASIDETGVPSLNLLNSNETSEPNGIEISFAVKTYDFNEFQEKAKRVFHYFKNKPTVLGGDSTFKNHAYSSNNVVLSGNGWKVCKLSTDGDHFPSINRHIKDGIIAIMGNIAYPVDYNQFSGQGKQEDVPDHIQKWNRAFNKADIDGWKNFLSEILNANLYLELEFKIGDLEMDVSREGLQYTKDVIKVLRKTTKEIYADLKDQFSSKIAAAKTIVEATSMYYTLSSLGGSWGTGAEWVDGDGKTHNIKGGVDIDVKVEANKSLYVFNYRTTGYRGKRKIMQTDRVHSDTLSGRSSRYYDYNSSSSSAITGKLTLFQCDIKSSETAKKVVLAYCNEHKLYAYLMIDTKDYTKSTDGFVELIKAFGESNVLKVSDYKHLVKQASRNLGTRTSAGSVSNQDVFLLYGNIPDVKALANIQYGEARYLKTLPQESLDSFLDQEVIVYVPILRYSSSVGFSSLGIIHDSIHSSSKILPELLDNHVYAIKESYVAQLKSKGHNLININDLLADCLAKKYAKDFVKMNDALSLALNLGNEHDHQYSNKIMVDQVFLFGILNIFGLDYKEMIKNPEIVSCVDQLMLWEFFRREAFDYRPDRSFPIKAFQKQDYFFLITSLLKDMGLDITSEVLSRKIRELKQLQTTVHSLYNFDDNTLKKYMSLITPKPKASITIKLEDMGKIQQTIEIELDKNPMLKYTIAVGYESSKVDTRDISDISPQLSTLRYTYDMATSQKCWIYKMTQKQKDLLKTQLGSVIS